MGTRGTYGFRVDGQDKLSYNHFDSYPDALGEDVLSSLKTLLRTIGEDEMREGAEKIKLVNDREKPENIPESVKMYHDPGVADGKSWYALLRHAQGKIGVSLELQLMTDADGFINDSLFCEWGYIVNLDDRKLEIYEGFQNDHHSKGRYASEQPNDGGYYPCALVAEYSFDDLPGDLSQIRQ